MKGHKKMKKFFRFAFILSFSVSILWPSYLRNKEYERLTIKKLEEGEIVSSVQPITYSRTHKCEVMGLIHAPIEKVWDNEGFWELTSFENNSETTLAVYTLYVDLGISLPKKIIGNGMKGIPNIISSLRQGVHNNVHSEKSYDKKRGD